MLPVGIRTGSGRVGGGLLPRQYKLQFVWNSRGEEAGRVPQFDPGFGHGPVGLAGPDYPGENTGPAQDLHLHKSKDDEHQGGAEPGGVWVRLRQ